MELYSEVTAAARRIVVHNNRVPHETTTLYDDSGNVVFTHPTGMQFRNSRDESQHAVSLSGTKHYPSSLTQRTVQDMLDAHTYARQRSSNKQSYHELSMSYLTTLINSRGRE